MVLTAVQENGHALQYAADCYRGDPEIVLAAVETNIFAFNHASEELLLDSSFAPEAKEACYILKISMLSGSHTYVVSAGHQRADFWAGCCKRLDIEGTGAEALLHGIE
eukprot:4399697-Amphidinium_carterae.1